MIGNDLAGCFAAICTLAFLFFPLWATTFSVLSSETWAMSSAGPKEGIIRRSIPRSCADALMKASASSSASTASSSSMDEHSSSPTLILLACSPDGAIRISGFRAQDLHWHRSLIGDSPTSFLSLLFSTKYSEKNLSPLSCFNGKEAYLNGACLCPAALASLFK